MDTLLEPILQSPRLGQYVQQLNEFYAAEQKRRLRFYEEMDESRKMEFIDGEVIVHSPAKNRHIVVTQNLSRLLSVFVITHEIGEIKTEKALVRLTRNDYEPDIAFFSEVKAVKFEKNTMYFPAPDMIVEVLSSSTEKNDRGIKFEDYALHHVGEYWIIDAEKESVEQYFLNEGSGRFELHSKLYNENENTISSKVIAGFKVAVNALFDEKANIKAIGQLK